jgi:plasmid stabilization system protein ParE
LVAFEGELAETIERIGRAPESFPVFIELRGHVIRRCLMPRSRCYLYIEVERNHVVVLGAAGSRQRRPRRFKLHETP